MRACRIPLITILACATALTACGLGERRPSASVTVTITPTPAAAPARPTPAATAASVKTIQANGITYALAVQAPVRSGDVIRVDASLHVVENPRNTALDPGLLSAGGTSWSLGVPNGFLLFDTVEKRLYRPASRSSKLEDAACGPTFNYTATRPGTAFDITCYFMGVPATVTPADLWVSSFGWVRGLPTTTRSDPFPEAPQGLRSLGSFELRGTVVEEAKEITASRDEIDVRLNSNVLFGKDSAVLLPAAAGQLAEVGERLGSAAPGAVAIVGHTDDLGSADHGLTLSRQRAEAVRTALAAKLGAHRVSVEGKGESSPVVPNTDEASRAKNRRVEISYRKG